MDLQQVATPIIEISMAVRSELERLGEQHSCIFAGAVLTEVLHRNGYNEAFPLTVRAMICNPAYTRWAKQNGLPRDPESQEKCEAAGGRMIGLGVESGDAAPAGRWAGHLVVVIPQLFGDRHAVSDVTISQACKRDWGIDLPPLLIRAPDSFVKGKKEFKPEANGSLLVYMAFPDDHTYEGYPLWTDKGRWMAAADRVIASLNRKEQPAPAVADSPGRSLKPSLNPSPTKARARVHARDMSPRERAEERKRRRKKGKKRGH